MTKIAHELIIPQELAGLRYDQALAKMFPDYSRERLKAWLKSGECLIDGKISKPKDKAIGQEWVILNTELLEEVAWQAEEKELDIVYHDDDIIVVNKTAQCVVHPAAGNQSGTLVNALLHHFPDLVELPRAGIVHRLDKDTTGLMVVARSLRAHQHLVHLLQEREISRSYLALVQGELPAGGTVTQPIGRHPRDRTRMAVVEDGKFARTHFRVEQRFREHTLLQVKLDTGRTHQIRVHLSFLKHVIVGDKSYGYRPKFPKQCSMPLQQQLQKFSRQALHAQQLQFVHPDGQQQMNFHAPLPDDFAKLISIFQDDSD